MKIEIEKHAEDSIDILHFDSRERHDATYIANSKNSALLVVDALLDGKDPPRDYRKPTARKIQIQPL